jgi:replication factor C subunit 1
MDEVDGMAGNEDRGGVQELIGLIKKSKVPIICICNDRQHLKIRSLANYCFDLRFAKPRVEQIRSALLTICFKEGIKIGPDTLDQIIVGANHDIRQCMHNLCIWSATNKNFDKQKTQVDIEKAIKDIRINPFEATRQLFSYENKSQSLSDRMDLFFTDYSLMPLLIHENYLTANPSGLKNKNTSHYLNLLNESIDAICIGDYIS